MAPKNQRWWLTQDSEQIVIDAAPERLYEMVADLRRMGEWSPECQAVEWEGRRHRADRRRQVCRPQPRRPAGPHALVSWRPRAHRRRRTRVRLRH